jgi:hypothetical protein
MEMIWKEVVDALRKTTKISGTTAGLRVGSNTKPQEHEAECYSPDRALDPHVYPVNCLNRL